MLRRDKDARVLRTKARAVSLKEWKAAHPVTATPNRHSPAAQAAAPVSTPKPKPKQTFSERFAPAGD